MKKWLIGGVILFLLGCQFLIPKKVNVSKTIVANANLDAVFRFLSNDSKWAAWWPSANSDPHMPGGFQFDKYSFRKTKTRYNAFGIEIKNKEKKNNSNLNLLPVGYDSVQIVWTTTLQAGGNNPFSKILLFFEARHLQKSFQTILSALDIHVSKVENLYGFDIRPERIQVEHTVSTRKTLPRFPTNDDVYALIGSIENHIAKQQLKVEGLPVFHIRAEDSVNYDLLVAIPVDKSITDSGDFKAKKLLRNGRILVTEFNGSWYTAQRALKAIETFANDHHFRNIALPYQIFLNDRTAEKDTSKWRTRLSYPVL